MAKRDSVTSLGGKLIRLVKRLGAQEDFGPKKTITHHVPIEHADGRLPSIYAVDFIPTIKGMFLVSCRELPQILFTSRGEADGLARAELAIEEAISSRRSGSDAA